MKKYIVRLSEEEHEYLNGIITEGKTAAYKTCTYPSES
jgi:hypothetical protein